MGFQKDLSVLLTVKKHQRNIKAGEYSCNHEVIASSGIKGSRICQLKKENHSLTSMSLSSVSKCALTCHLRFLCFFSIGVLPSFSAFRIPFLEPCCAFQLSGAAQLFLFLRSFWYVQRKKIRVFPFLPSFSFGACGS